MAYQKTEWLPYETLVSAENLNKIEDQLHSVTSIAEINEMAIKSTDTQVKALGADVETVSETIASHMNENATSTTKGHVQLSSAINSEDEGIAATSKAVKVAYDRAEQAFQSASNGKNLIANAVTGKGIPTSVNDTFQQMATNITNISTGTKNVKTVLSSEVWTVPENVKEISVITIGGGGSGGHYNNSSGNDGGRTSFTRSDGTMISSGGGWGGKSNASSSVFEGFGGSGGSATNTFANYLFDIRQTGYTGKDKFKSINSTVDKGGDKNGNIAFGGATTNYGIGGKGASYGYCGSGGNGAIIICISVKVTPGEQMTITVGAGGSEISSSGLGIAEAGKSGAVIILY